MWKTIISRSVKYRFPLIIGLLLIFLRFYPLFFGKALLFGDNFSLMVPGKLFSAQWLAQGIVPLWNPTQFAGISWVGDINQSLFYPSTVLFILFRPSVALNITLLSHLLLTFLGAYFLAREISPKLSTYSWLLVAVFWSFSPQLMGALNNIATFQSISYIPLVVLGCLHFGRNKKYSWLYLPVLICLQLLGGYPQHVFFTVVFGVIFATLILDNSRSTKLTFYSKLLARWIGVGFISLLLTAWIWLPFLQDLRQSTRSLQTAEQAQTGSLHPDDLIKIILPTFFENPSVGYKWGPSWNRPANIFMYFTWLGIIAVWVLLLTKKKNSCDLVLFGSLLVCILISFGQATPLHSIIQMIPVLESSRGASTILVIATLIGSILCSRAIFTLNFTSKNYKKYLLIVAAASSILLFSWLITSMYFDKLWLVVNTITNGVLENSAFHTVARDRVLATSILFNLAIQSLLLLFSFWFLSKRRLLIFMLIIALDLFFFTKQYYFFGPSSVYDLPSNMELLTQVNRSLGSTYRLLTRNYNTSYTDFGAYADALIVRQPFSDSFVNNNEIQNFSVANQMKQLLTPGWNITRNVCILNGYTTLLPTSILQDFGTKLIEPGINRLPEIPTTHEQLQKWSVGYYLVDTWYPDYGEQFPNTIVASGEGWQLYQLPNSLSRIRYQNGESATIKSLNENPNELIMTVESDQAQDLIVADRYDPDWRATANGKSVEVSNIDGMRSIPLEQGTNNIRLWYSPMLFYVGALVSGSTLLLLGLGFFVVGSVGRPSNCLLDFIKLTCYNEPLLWELNATITKFLG